MNADGSHRRELTHNRGWDGMPAWSPDGRVIAFASDRLADASGGQHIFIMGANGGAAYRVSNTAGGWPVWSPDGRSLLFVALTDPIRLRIVDASGERDFTTVSGPAFDPAWSSENVIAFTQGVNFVDIFTVPVTGGSPTNLTEPFRSYNLRPDWSPDGQEIAFDSDRATPFEQEVFTMRADGSDPQRLTDSPGLDVDPDWSPAGDLIAFTSYRDVSEPTTLGELYIMQADGSNQRRATFAGGVNGTPDWRPTTK